MTTTLTTDGDRLFRAVCVAVDQDGRCNDETVLGAFVDWMQEQDLVRGVCVKSGLEFELEVSVGHQCLFGRWGPSTSTFAEFGPGSGFGEWLVQSIGFDYYLDGK